MLPSTWQQPRDRYPPCHALSLLQTSVADRSANTFGRVVTWGAVTANGADVFGNPAGARRLVVDVSQVLQTRRRLYVLWAVHRIHLRTTGRHRRQNLSRGGQNRSITAPERKQGGSESGAFHGTPPSSPFAFLCFALRSPPTHFHCNRLRVQSHARAVGLAQSEACHTGFFSACRERGVNTYGESRVAEVQYSHLHGKWR